MDGMDVTARYLKDQFVSSIFSDDNTKRLSRTPHLLTMMALIFRKRAHLPNGRAILYDAIAQAYLESIDQARGIKDDYDWQLKKILLARVAFEMQLQRLALEKNDDFLVEKTLVLGWIKDEMAKHSQSEDSSYVDTFLNWIARRSGLLLPRGVDQYAFLHLSFQEYFAAVYIQSQLENPAWFDREDAETLDDRVSDITFPAWANEVAWSQTLIFLYELMSKKSGWSKRLWRYLFEQQPQPATEDGTKPAVIDLKWSFISNRHCVIDKTMFEKAKNEIFQYSVQEQQAIKNIFTINLSKLLLNQILNTESLLQDYIDFFQKEFNSTNIVLSRVDFSGKEEFLQAISKKQLLEFIHIENCSLDSLPNFNTLKKIRHITIKSNKINELDYDFASEKIHKLTIGSNEVNQQKNIKSLQNLKNIESLTLHQDFDSDLSWIAKCTKIQNLTIIGDFDCNMIAPAAIKKIKSLTLISNHIARTEKIALMDNLEYLIIMSEQTLEIDYFHNFKKIKIMMLSNVHSNNWNSLLFLPKLTILTVNREFIDNSVVDTLRNKGVHVDFVD
jgi:hypothetical protein